MTVFGRAFALFLLPGMLALPAFSATPLPAVYAVKPDWWDSTVMHSPPVTKLTDPAVAWALLTATNSPWMKPLEGWRVVGPFDGVQGRGMDVAYPPEQAVTKAAMAGKGGASVEWWEWKAGKPCPLPGGLKDAIAYGFRQVRLDVPSHTWLVVEGSGRMKAWVDGRPVMDVRSNETGAAVLELNTGLHAFLLKLDIPSSSTNATFRAALLPSPPDQVAIRCRSIVIQRWPDDSASVLRHGLELARLYGRLGDVPNFRFWVSRVFALQKDPGQFAAVSGSWGDVVSQRPEIAQALNATLRDFFIASRDNAPLRDSLGASMLQHMTFDDMETGIRAFRGARYEPPLANVAQFMNMCVESNRLAALPYWVEQYMRREPDPLRISYVLRPLMTKASDVARQALYTGIETCLQTHPPEKCAPLISFYAETALARGDTERLDHLINLQGGLVRSVMPFDAAMWDLEVARAELDQDRARAALAAAVLAKPAYTNAPGYDRARGEIFKMRAGTASPGAILNDPDEVAQTIARYARQNETGRLHGYIRHMLVDHGHVLVNDANDNNLFTSAKAIYRNLFAGYAATYAQFLTREIADLATRTGQATESDRLLRCASLTPPPTAPATPPAALRTQAQVAELQGVFGGQLDLPPGTLEACGEDTRMARLGAWQPVLSGSGTDCNGLLVVQNSRGVAALANGGLLWSYVAQLNPAPNLRWSAYVMGFGGLCRPVRVGGLVVVRLETSAGRFELIAFDARSGVIRWRWHGLTEAEEPAGSPAVWRGTTVLVPVLRSNSKEQVSELSLVAIDGDSGRELYRLPLAVSRAPIESQACANWGLVQYRTLAAPTVVGDSAYVDTGLGMICAIDLQDECVRWARLYQRKFNDNGGGMRVSVSPVVGSRNVLFAPVDSRWILLVDLATGALVQRRTDLAWTSIGRCGPENVLVTTPSAMQVMSLAGMEVGKVVDKAHMLHVAALADGCVASANGELAVLNNQGEIVRSMKTPADVVPSCLDAEGHWWGWGGLDGRTWGRLDDTTARRPMHLPVVAAGTGPMLLPYRTEPYVATWVPAAEGSYRVCQSLLTRVNPDGTLRWEVPLSWDSTAMACGKRVAVSMCGRVWTLDDASGSICSVWPPLMGASNDVAVARVTTRGPSLYASTVLTPGRMRIWDLGVEGRETAVPMMDLTAWPPGNDFWVTTVATQTFVVTHTPDDRDVFLFRANRLETPRTAPVAEAVQDIHWGGTANATIWYDSMRRNAIIFGRSPAETVRFNSNDGVQRHAIQGVADLWDGTATPLGDLMVFRYQHDAFDRVTDPESGSSVTLRELKDDKMERPLWEFSGVIGTEVFGMRSLATNQLMVFRQDLARGTVASDAAQRAVLAGPVPEPADLWRGVVPLGDGRIMMLASSKSTYDELMRGYIWTPGSTDVKTVFLPGSKPPVQALSSNLWVCGDGLLTSADWARAAAPETQLLRVSWTNNYVSSDNFVADGFLDEWKDEEFLAIPQGRLAVRRPGGRSEVFRVAVDITNQAVAAAVAANPDINAVCRIWAARSEAAGFNVLRPHMGLLSNEEVAQGLTRRCAWQVSPDGRHCTLELELAVGYVTVRNPGETPSVRAQQLGDIALRLSIDDPQLGVVDLVGNSRLGALGFVRLLLP